MGLYDDVAGVADHLAGSTDEAVGRQFDDERGSGFADPDTYTDDEELTARFRDIQDQAKKPWTLLPGATLVNPDTRIGYVEGENVGGMTDVDAQVADHFGLGGELDAARSANALNDPEKRKWIVYGVGAAIALYLLKPLLELAANLSE
jgi:hypothetical protein